MARPRSRGSARATRGAGPSRARVAGFARPRPACACGPESGRSRRVDAPARRARVRGRAAAGRARRGRGRGPAPARSRARARGRGAATQLPVGSSTDGQRPPNFADGFHFGSYGRVVAAGDGRGRPRPRRRHRRARLAPRRVDLRRARAAPRRLLEGDRQPTTRVVATLALAHPIFHYNGDFDAKIALRNLYLEETRSRRSRASRSGPARACTAATTSTCSTSGRSTTSTPSAAARATSSRGGTFIKVHAGSTSPTTASSARWSRARCRSTSSAPPRSRSSIASTSSAAPSSATSFRVGETGGVKVVALRRDPPHPPGPARDRGRVPASSRTSRRESGFVAGGAARPVHRRARHPPQPVRPRTPADLAAYGEFATPDQLVARPAPTKGARELIVALGGNYEVGPFGVMLGGVLPLAFATPARARLRRRRRGHRAVRPHVFFGEVAGIALEGSYQAQQRGVRCPDLPGRPRQRPAVRERSGASASCPFSSPAGRGDYARPQFRAHLHGHRPRRRAPRPSTRRTTCSGCATSTTSSASAPSGGSARTSYFATEGARAHDQPQTSCVLACASPPRLSPIGGCMTFEGYDQSAIR